VEKNKVRFGLENLHIAFETAGGGYGTPIRIPGVVGFNVNPDGQDSVFYADNIKYYVRNVNNGYTGEVEIALIPDDIVKEMLGWVRDTNGVLLEDAEGNPKPFALMAQVEGDGHGRRFVYYYCQASRPSQSASTKTETVTPNTETLPLVILPKQFNGKKVVKAVVEPDAETKAIYDAWFDAVYVPDGNPAVVNKEHLEAAIALAGTLTAADYTVASWTALSSALTAAQTIFGNASATQAQVNAATTALQEAILGLEVKESNGG